VASEVIRYKRVKLGPQPAVRAPRFGESHVLASDPWDFVSLHLKAANQRSARFYWEQARSFYHAAEGLPQVAAPLPAYYSVLNASKALLLASSAQFSDRHGVSGRIRGDKKAKLPNEELVIQTGGVLPALSLLVGYPITDRTSISLDAAFYNLPFLHRAYCLTFSSSVPLFLPMHNPHFVRKSGSTDAWIQGTVSGSHAQRNWEKSLPTGWEADSRDSANLIVRRKKRFSWNGREMKASRDRLVSYHRNVRTVLEPIYASETRWYLRKSIASDKRLDLPTPTLTFACIHRLSELARYTPERLARHLESKHNWLVAEFLRVAPSQFIYFVACELTGADFAIPFAHSSQIGGSK
jgi:hypothetical protein